MNVFVRILLFTVKSLWLIPRHYFFSRPTEAELAIRVTKEVKQLRDYERNLLMSYQAYLKLLEQCWALGGKQQKSNDDPVSVSPIAVTAMLSLCALLKSAYLFNFRSNILSLVVRSMNSKCDEVSQSCCAAVSEIFEKDLQGDVSLEAVRLIASMLKNRNFKVKDQVIRTFLSLPLRVHQDEAEAAKLHEKAKNKKRKRDVERANIEDELKEGKTTVDKSLLARAQADTLHTITLTYFRILKMRSDGKKSTSELLPAALEGLAKFSHLINMDTIEDLLKHLKDLLSDVDSLPLDAALNSILTAFNTLQGPGRELQIDQKEYVAPLYSQLQRYVSICSFLYVFRIFSNIPLFRLCSQSTIEYTQLMLRCLNFAFLKRREFSSVRIASFVKQLCTVAMHTPPHCASAMISFARMLLHRYQNVHQLLENEADVVASGKYSPEVYDPDHGKCLDRLSVFEWHI